MSAGEVDRNIGATSKSTPVAHSNELAPRRVSFSKSYNFELAAIKRITLSPWIVGDLANSVIQTLRQIDDCKGIKIFRLTLVDSEQWQRLALRLDPSI